MAGGIVEKYLATFLSQENKQKAQTREFGLFY